MGLDMYLYRKTYVKNWDHMSDKEKHRVTILRGGSPRADINTEKVSEIVEEVAYWRKANHIHNWFVSNVQDGKDDCEEYYVPREKLKELVDICIRIRNECSLIDGDINNGYSWSPEGGKVYNVEKGKIMTNTELAEELLPTKEGFFFGSVDYDQWYMQDIESTIEMLTPLVEEEYEGTCYYQSSW